jgi:WD40 repeat protein
MTALYNAFISYSRASDKDFASILHATLQHFPSAWTLRPALRIFFDKTSLYGPSLSQSIETALNDSAWLLLLASEESAKSPWVCDEIEWWLAHNRLSKLIILLTGGEIVWDREKNDFDWLTTTALPSSLQGKYTDVPFYIDLRRVKDHRQYSIDSLLFRDPIATIAAALHNKPKDELDSEDIRQRKKFITIRRAVVALLLVLTTGLLGFMGWSSIQHNKALQNQIDATANAAENALFSDMQLEALTGAVIAGQLLQSTNTIMNRSLAALISDQTFNENAAKITVQLNRILHNFHESNRFEGHSDSVTALANSSGCNGGSNFLISGSRNGKILKWVSKPILNQELSYEKALEIDFGSRVTSVAIRPGCSEIAAAGSDNSLKKWKADGALLADLKNTAEISKVVYTSDGSYLISGDDSGNIAFWNRNGIRTSLFQEKDSARIMAMAIQRCADGTEWLLIGSASPDRPLKLFELEYKPDSGLLKFGLKRAIVSKDKIKSLAVSVDCSRFAVGHVNGEISLHRMDGTPYKTWEAHTGPVTSMEFSANGRFIVSGGETNLTEANLTNGNLVEVWTINGEPAATFKGHRRPVSATLFSHDSQSVISASADKSIRIWSLTSWPVVDKQLWQKSAIDTQINDEGDHVIAVNIANQIESLDLTTGKNTILAGKENIRPYLGANKTIYLFDKLHTGLKPYGNSEMNLLRGNQGNIAGLKFSPDGKQLAVVDTGGQLVLWDVDAKNSVAIAKAELNENNVAFSPDGKILAALTDASRQPTLIIRFSDDAKREFPIDSQDGVNQIVFSPDGKTIATGGNDRRIALWNLAGNKSGELIGHDRDVRQIAFHPVNNMIASADSGGTIIVWSGNGRLLARLNEVRLSNIWSLHFSKDGKWLIGGGQDSVTRWQMDLQALLQLGCKALAPYLSTHPNEAGQTQVLCRS